MTVCRTPAAGYLYGVFPVDQKIVEIWKRSRVYRMLRLGGYVAFDLPRTVTALGGLLLFGILLTSTPNLPGYFVVYATLVIAWCLLATVALWLSRNPAVPQLGWFLGSLLSVLFVVSYLVTRAVTLPGLADLTGRWGVASGTFAVAFAAGFVVVHMSVLLGINVAYPHRQGWTD
jgi:hypothetical protein